SGWPAHRRACVGRVFLCSTLEKAIPCKATAFNSFVSGACSPVEDVLRSSYYVCNQSVRPELPPFIMPALVPRSTSQRHESKARQTPTDARTDHQYITPTVPCGRLQVDGHRADHGFDRPDGRGILQPL